MHPKPPHTNFTTADPQDYMLLMLMGRNEPLQDHIAKLCGTSSELVRFWMLGHRSPNWEQTLILARELDEPLIIDAFKHPAAPMNDGEHVSDASLEIEQI